MIGSNNPITLPDFLIMLSTLVPNLIIPPKFFISFLMDLRTVINLSAYVRFTFG